MSKYQVSDLVEFKSGMPRWVLHPEHDNRWISWDVYYNHSKPVLESKYALICHVDKSQNDCATEEYWGESKYGDSQWGQSGHGVADANNFYRVLYNNLYCMVKESDILSRVTL